MEPVTKWTRLTNFIIDLLIIRLALLHYGVYPILRVVSPAILTYHVGSIWYMQYVINYTVIFVYYLGMEATAGLTFGKLITQTRVVTADGYQPTTRDIFLRNTLEISSL